MNDDDNTGPRMNGAESLVHTLIDSGIEVCFANPGTSEMHFVNALDRIEGIRPILGLFEGVVTGAADGYARMAGKPAATLLHLGPGLANGLANLHNARKAQTPVVNIIGNHATTHQRFETPLASDVEAFARPVSHWVHSTRVPSTVAADAARAVQAARTAPGQVASLILPADTAWLPAHRSAPALPVNGPAPVGDEAIAQTLTALRSGGRIALLLRGDVLRGAGLKAAGRIAAATGAQLLSDTFAPRIERGAGRVPVVRVPYRPSDATAVLAEFDTLILVGTQAPVAFFAYPGQAGELTPPSCRTLVLSQPHEDGTLALREIADAVGAPDVGAVNEYRPPELPRPGALDAGKIMSVIASLLPEGAIISDEGITGSLGTYPLLDTAAPHDHLQLTGGSIGDGVPVAVGAAVACPDRKVLALEGDGSAMYTLQALWTQAREDLDVTTVIYANRSYKVLNQELTLMGTGEPGPRAVSLLDLHNPDLSWVKLAEGMGVEAVRVDDTVELEKALRSAFGQRGPRLIEAVI